MKLNLVFCVMAVLSLTASARPALQPFPRECVWENDAVDASALPVVRDDVRQCAIGADEVLATGARSVYAGEELKDAVYLAIEGSPLAQKLVAAFKLDVPQKAQGYALAVEKGRVAVVGHDPVGTLYGAETVRQLMAEGGRVPAVRIRDWPDYAWRGKMALWSGLRLWGEDDKTGIRVEGVKAGLDEMLRHKLNLVYEFHTSGYYPTEAQFAAYREIFAYARERGIRPTLLVPQGVYSHLNKPADLKPNAGWDCNEEHRPWFQNYLCWSRDEATEKMALWWVDYLRKMGISEAFFVLHPLDTCGPDGRDPERFSKRCAGCRARWNDDERWKATAHQLNLYTRVMRREIPGLEIGSCMQPYVITQIAVPEKGGARDAIWKRNTIDFWHNVDGALEDPTFFFAGWSSYPACLREFRKCVPSRRYRFSDTYAFDSGVFTTSNRKVGTMFEDVDGSSFTVCGLIAHGRWESMLLAGEFMWNTRAPGWEDFDGRAWYDPFVDHTGPAVLMGKTLPAICRTFWGERLGPSMADFFGSGVLPEYLTNPGNAYDMWNRLRRNAMFDFEGGVPDVSNVKVGLPPVDDSADFAAKQVEAAERAVRALAEARKGLADLPRPKQRYLGAYLRRAPFWLASAHVRSATLAVRELFRRGDVPAADALVRKALARVERDYEAAEANVRSLDQAKLPDIKFNQPYGFPRARAEADLKVLAEIVRAATPKDESSREAAYRLAKARVGADVGAAADFPQQPTDKDQVWEGEKVIDTRLELHSKNLFIRPGTKVRFRGDGKLVVRWASLYAAGASFEADTELTGDFRIYVERGVCWLGHCRFRNLRCTKSSTWGSGFLRAWGTLPRRCPSIVRNCTFENCSSVSVAGSSGDDFADCLFTGGDSGVCILNGNERNVRNNVFRDIDGLAVEMCSSEASNILGNFFENCKVGTRFAAAKNACSVGNAYYATTPYRISGEGKDSPVAPLTLGEYECRQRPTEIMFWFDTENYTEEFAAEPIKDIANILTEEGVRGHFCLVGYEAKKLVDWRRTDILDALKPHVIGSQTLYHTWHPNITESTDLEDFDAAYAHAAREEYLSMGMIQAATGCEKILCSVLPGNGNTMVALYLYADMGIPFFGGGCGVYDDGKHAEIWYCNQRHRPYCPWMHLESFLPGKAPADVEKQLDRMAQYEGLTLYMHPHMAVVTCHPDGLNWDKRNQTPFGKWIPCPHRDPADTKVYYERLRAFVRRLKDDPRFEITDCEKLLARQKPRRAITRADLPAIRSALEKDFGPVSRPASWCVADCFVAAVTMLRGGESYLPAKAYGFLYAPQGVARETVVRRTDIVAAARAMDVTRFLPHTVRIGDAEIGPADFLFAALTFLTTEAETVTVRPREQLGDIASKLPNMATFKCAGTWRYMPEFKDNWISNRLRWQFWTLRYE